MNSHNETFRILAQRTGNDRKHTEFAARLSTWSKAELYKSMDYWVRQAETAQRNNALDSVEMADIRLELIWAEIDHRAAEQERRRERKYQDRLKLLTPLFNQPEEAWPA